MHSRVLLLLCVAVAMAPSGADAQWQAFVPVPFENRAFVDSYTSFERDHIRSDTTSRWTDTFLRQRFTVSSNGYSYHPRFLVYQFSLSGLGREEYHDSLASGSPGWRWGSGVEYDVTLFFLPEHPYNLQVFSRRFEPMFKEQAAKEHSNVQTSNGVLLRYRQKPYFLRASYNNDMIESAETSSDINRLSLIAQLVDRHIKPKSEIGKRS